MAIVDRTRGLVSPPSPPLPAGADLDRIEQVVAADEGAAIIDIGGVKAGVGPKSALSSGLLFTTKGTPDDLIEPSRETESDGAGVIARLRPA